MQRIEFHYELDFQLAEEELYRSWIIRVLESENCSPGTINYVFCNDEYLHKMHREHLGKDTYTDIITFDYSVKDLKSGDIFISVERVRENAGIYKCGFNEELLRVMSHGLLHMVGYEDKEQDDLKIMRLKEEEKINMFHVEQ